MKPVLKSLAAALIFVAAAIAAIAETTLTWQASPPSDQVTKYLLEHRASLTDDWTRVEVDGTSSIVTIPETAFGRWFRIAAVNSFGRSEWTEPVKVPDSIQGLQIVISIIPTKN
jgi:hypothetical protein